VLRQRCRGSERLSRGLPGAPLGREGALVGTLLLALKGLRDGSVLADRTWHRNAELVDLVGSFVTQPHSDGLALMTPEPMIMALAPGLMGEGTADAA
jgi:hypothetical protein